MTLYNFPAIVYPLWTFFISILGLQLLNRLRVHRFPRTNLPHAWMEAKLDFGIQLVISIAVATGVTGLAALYLWWSK